MNKLFQITLYVVPFLLFISCKKENSVEKQQKQFLELQKADWFLGRWENNAAEGNLSESWKKENDSTFYGETYFVVENDTVFAEKIRLEERNGKLNYIVSIPNQNDEKPISFELNKNSSKQLIFENPSHDYPTKITYNHVGADSLVAEISGIKDGKVEKELFKMRKVR